MPRVKEKQEESTRFLVKSLEEWEKFPNLADAYWLGACGNRGSKQPRRG